MTPDELLTAVFQCSHCEGTRLPFVRSAPGKFYRFPPTIGSAGQAPLLFIGINPRVSESNHALHQSIVTDHSAFVQLSKNRVGGQRYIGKFGLEKHYRLHAEVADALFPGAQFEDVAAVTELHFCASETSAGLPSDSSRCARRYLREVLQQVSPTVVFAVGKHVKCTLRTFFAGEGALVAVWPTGNAPIIALPHPASFGPKLEVRALAITQAALHLLARREAQVGDGRLSG